jgi:hypothetical protein
VIDPIPTTSTATTPMMLPPCPLGTMRVDKHVLDCASNYLWSSMTGTHIQRLEPSEELGELYTAFCDFTYQCVRTIEGAGPATCSKLHMNATVLNDPTAQYCDMFGQEPYVTHGKIGQDTVWLPPAERAGKTYEEQTALLKAKCDMKLMTSTTATTTAAKYCAEDDVPLGPLGEPTGGFLKVSCCVP